MEIRDVEVENLYFELKKEWESNLKKDGVKFPRLKRGDSFTKDALVLVYLYKKYGKKVTKTELTSFIQQYYPETNDVQQARHLAAQKGWFILSGTRGDFEAKERNIHPGEYMLASLEKCYPNFTQQRRDYNLESADGWEKLKKSYDYRCATCGSKEGESNFHYPSSITKLQKGHMNPERPLESGNIIPQCEKCNRPDRNYFVYNEKGRVIKIADPKFVFKSNERVQREIFELLKRKYSK